MQKTMLKRMVPALVILLMGLLCLAVAVQVAEAETLKLESLYDKAALAPNVSVDVNVLVTIKAPEVKWEVQRPPVAVSLVLDRSGSMDEAGKMDYARRAAKTLIRSLEPKDLFSLVVYDSEVDVLHPLGPVKDKKALLAVVDRIEPNSTTFLSGGLEKGIKELRSVRGEGPCRVILVSDGLANRGVTGEEQVAAIGARARNSGIGVSSIGLGLDFNEDMMQLLAQRGGGQYYYIKDSEDLPAVFTQELGLIAASFTKNLQTRFEPAPGVRLAKIYGYSTTPAGAATNIEMGDFSSGEERQVLMRLSVEPGPEGTRSLGHLRLEYTDPQDSAARSMDVPVDIKVLADEAARREAERQQAGSVVQVRDASLLMEAEEAHVQAMAELEKGNVEAARGIMRAQQKQLALAAPTNVVAKNKLEQLQLDEQSLDRARQDVALQKSMSKQAKSSAYLNAKGQKQGIMLQRGDKGFMVEKLQTALKNHGAYAGPVDGVYSPELEAAVKAFQTDQSLDADGIAGPQTLRALGL